VPNPESMMKMFDEYHQALKRIGVLNYQSMKESGEAWFLSHYLTARKVPVVFDVGTNKGDFTRAVLAVNPRARVMAFEPHPVTFAQWSLPKDDPQVQCFNVALGANPAKLEFFDYLDGDGSSHASLYKGVIEEIHGQASTSHVVDVRTLDDVAEELEVHHIDLLKVDTEGHEFPVLLGGEKLIRSGAVDVIQFEFNEMNVVSRVFFKDFWDFLPEYDFFRLMRDGGELRIGSYIPALCEIFAFQNIVCVRKGLKVF